MMIGDDEAVLGNKGTRATAQANDGIDGVGVGSDSSFGSISRPSSRRRFSSFGICPGIHIPPVGGNRSTSGSPPKQSPPSRTRRATSENRHAEDLIVMSRIYNEIGKHANRNFNARSARPFRRFHRREQRDRSASGGHRGNLTCGHHRRCPWWGGGVDLEAIGLGDPCAAGECRWHATHNKVPSRPNAG